MSVGGRLRFENTLVIVRLRSPVCLRQALGWLSGVWVWIRTTSQDEASITVSYIFEKGKMNPPHNLALSRVRRHLEARLPPDWCLRQQMDVSVPGGQPQPDAAVIAGTDEDLSSFLRRRPYIRRLNTAKA